MIAGLLMALRSRWWVIALCTVASMLGAFITASRMPPRYLGTANVLMELVKPDPETGEVIPGKMLENYIGTQVRLAASAATTRHMIAQFGWLNDPVLQQEYDQSSAGAGTMESWLADRLAGAVSISIPEGTNLLQLSYSAPDPESARLLVDSLRSAFLTEALERKHGLALDSVRWLDKQIVIADARYNAALKARNDYAASHGMVLDQNPGLQKRLAQVLMQRRSVAGSIPLADLGGGGDDSAAESNGQVPRRSHAALGTDSHLETLRQQAALAGNSYLSLVARQTQALQDSRAAEANMSAFGEAIAPDDPYFPKFGSILGGAALLGFLLSAEVVLLFELLNRRVRLGGDLQMASACDVLSIVRRSRKRTRILAWLISPLIGARIRYARIRRAEAF